MRRALPGQGGAGLLLPFVPGSGGGGHAYRHIARRCLVTHSQAILGLSGQAIWSHTQGCRGEKHRVSGSRHDSFANRRHAVLALPDQKKPLLVFLVLNFAVILCIGRFLIMPLYDVLPEGQMCCDEGARRTDQ